MIVVTSYDFFSRFIIDQLLLRNHNISVLVLTKPTLKTKLNLIRSAIRSESFYYLFYMQVESFAAFIYLLVRQSSSLWRSFFLLRARNIEILKTSSLSSSYISSRLSKVDDKVILSIRPGLIFKLSFISQVGKPIINLHCSTLPSFGGIAAVMQSLAVRGASLGITFHTIDSDQIDKGIILSQHVVSRIPKFSVLRHTFMLYLLAAKILCDEFCEIEARALNKNFPSVHNSFEPSYFSWPSPIVRQHAYRLGHSLYF